MARIEPVLVGTPGPPMMVLDRLFERAGRFLKTRVLVFEPGGSPKYSVFTAPSFLQAPQSTCSPIAKPAKLRLPCHQVHRRRHASLCNFALALQLRFSVF